MHEILWTALFAGSLIIFSGCALVNAANYFVRGSGGSGFLPDTAMGVLGLVQCAAIILCVFSRIKQTRSKELDNKGRNLLWRMISA